MERQVELCRELYTELRTESKDGLDEARKISTRVEGKQMYSLENIYETTFKGGGDSAIIASKTKLGEKLALYRHA